MFCLIACFIGGNPMPHKKLIECSHSYSQNQLVQIHGIIWTVICSTLDRKIWMYYSKKSAEKFITTFSLFHLDSNGDFIQLHFANGVDKIETTHDHEPEICGNIVQVRLSNGKQIDVYLGDDFVFTKRKI
jgi:hypothetical protein